MKHGVYQICMGSSWRFEHSLFLVSGGASFRRMRRNQSHDRWGETCKTFGSKTEAWRGRGGGVSEIFMGLRGGEEVVSGCSRVFNLTLEIFVIVTRN
jgi:hypothetical protein